MHYKPNYYYPFGMLQPGRSYAASNFNKYRFGFNGKENDSDVKGEGNLQDYGMRIYDPRLGKFLSVDPLGKDYPWNSSYAFAENDVIRSIDLDGMEKLIYTFTKANGVWNKTQIELAKAGPLGNGVLVKYDNGKTKAFYYGSEMEAGSTGEDFSRYYESLKRDKQGNIIAYTIPGEPHTTVGYGHYNDSPSDEAAYPNGTVITQEKADELFATDYTVRKASTDMEQFEDDALTDYTFTATNTAAKAEARFKKSKDKSNFYVDNIKAKSSKVAFGVARRRSAEQILHTYHKYTKLNYNKLTQKKWEKVYNASTSNNTSTDTKSDVEEDKPKIQK